MDKSNWLSHEGRFSEVRDESEYYEKGHYGFEDDHRVEPLCSNTSDNLFSDPDDAI